MERTLLCTWVLLLAADGAAQDAGARLQLSPLAVARSAAEQAEAPPSPPVLSEHELSEKVPGLVRASKASAMQKVAHAIDETVWRVLAPWRAKELKREPRYWYVGRTIDAAIMDDGSVHIRNKRGILLTATTYQELERGAGGESGFATTGPDGRRTLGSPSAPALGVAVANSGSSVERIMTGKEPANAELRTFLEGSRPLRERLIEQQRERDWVSSERKLYVALDSLWNGFRPVDERQRATFTLWDECAEDEVGSRGRAYIEAFTRKLQAARGECPFSAEVLARLNATRRSKQPFQPCEPAAELSR